MSENKLTPEVTAMIKSIEKPPGVYMPSVKGYDLGFLRGKAAGIRFALTDPTLLKAQGLFTTEQVKGLNQALDKFITHYMYDAEAAGMIKQAMEAMKALLPTPPKTEV